MGDRRTVILIHGVGGTTAGAMREAVSGLQRHSGVAPTEIFEFHWNALVTVARPPAWLMRPWTMIGGETMDAPHSEGYFSGLIRGLSHSAMVGVDSWLPPLLFLLISLTSLFLVWIGQLACLGIGTAISDSDSWRALIDISRLPTIIVGQTVVLHSRGLLRIAVTIWLAVIVAVATIYLFSRTRKGLSSLAAAFRTIVLIVVWQAVILVPIVAILFLLSGFTFLTLVSGILTFLTYKTWLVVAFMMAMFLCLTRAVALPLKVLADIFRYVGDCEYRAEIQAGFDRTLNEIKLEGTDLWLVGHSLGSVIALHLLSRNDARLHGCRSITLVTLG